MRLLEVLNLMTQVLMRKRVDGAVYIRHGDLRANERHHAGFWAFTGAQGCFMDDEGKQAIPASAWLEYIEWLAEDEASPETASYEAKQQWRMRKGRIW